jgi:hypothetical protein
MFSFCHLVIIAGKRGQSWHTALLILVSFESLGLDFINILFCVFSPLLH